jgi:glycerol-3-phosphate O-acyltransferase
VKRSDVARNDDDREASAPPARTIFLLDANSGLERRLLQEWIDSQHPAAQGKGACDVVSIPPTRGRRRRPDPRLEACLATGDDPLLAPLRIAWLPRERDGERVVRPTDLWTFGDPRDPNRLRQEWLARRDPDRYRVVVGEPAPLSDLRRRWTAAAGTDAAQTLGLADFVARQAALALERAERRLRGARYKVPRFVREDILSRPVFQGGVRRLAVELARGEKSVGATATRYLGEIAATHSPYVIDLAAHLIHWLYTRGYNETLRFDRAQLERLFALGQRHPLVFLPTHKSNFDHLALQYVLYQTGHPPNHTAGGINMNFFPIGPLLRRSGVFFIRRTFKDNPIYKFVLQQYVDYLIEKRFTLEWYLEGGRSRSGKLLPPRFGLFAYVVDAYRRGRSEDVLFIPVAIAYDQIEDVGDYVAEQRGAAKESESFGWFLRLIRKLRRGYGDIHIRFGEPLSLAEELGAPTPEAEPNPDEQNLSVQKIAFEVAVRINRVTPITPTSLVTLALLGRGDRALTVGEVAQSVGMLVDYARERDLPSTVDLLAWRNDGIERTLDNLVDSGVATVFREGTEAVYAIGPDQHLAAAYYRNTIIHFFVNAAIAELALLRAAEPETRDTAAAFWEETLRLRDLLKFEFFFADREEFQTELRRELALHAADWEQRLGSDAEAAMELLRRFRPFSAHRVLRPFVEAYRVVADVLEHGEKELSEADLLNRCLAVGKQYSLQRRIRSGESVSKVLFATALRLARNRKLFSEAVEERRRRRHDFAAEMRHVVRRIDTIEALATSRQLGLID